MNHIVKVRISSQDWDRTQAQCDWDELPPVPTCFVPLIRFWKHVKDIRLGDAKAAIENTVGREPKYGEFTFLLTTEDVGRLYMFLRDGNHITTRTPGHLAGYEVLEILNNKQGGIIA